MTDVGHRALVAYERDRDRYDLHYSHWGAHEWQLASALTADHPFGRRQSAASGQSAAVDPAPLVTDCPFDAIVDDHLDYQQYEALYLVTERFAVEPFLVCWFGLPGVDTNRPGDGGLVAVEATDVATDGAFLRGRFTGAKETVCQLVEQGAVDPATARSSLTTLVRSWAGDGRAVHLGPTASTTADR